MTEGQAVSGREWNLSLTPSIPVSYYTSFPRKSYLIKSLLAKKSPARVKAPDWTGDSGLRTGPLVSTLPLFSPMSPRRVLEGGEVERAREPFLRRQGLFLPGTGLLCEKQVWKDAREPGRECGQGGKESTVQSSPSKWEGKCGWDGREVPVDEENSGGGCRWQKEE